MAKKDNVHLQLSEELAGIDAELDLAMEALSETNTRIDTFLNDGEDGEIKIPAKPAAELPDEGDEVSSEEVAEGATDEPKEVEESIPASDD